MDDTTLAKKLDQFVRLGNALNAEAKRRYGPEAFLAHEADSGIFLMSQDVANSSHDRRKHDWIKEEATLHPKWQAIAW